MDIEKIKQGAKIELARRDFFSYCNLMSPSFYKYDREYLINMCNELQDFYESKDEKIMIINLPPRHGKSYTATLFTQWILGKDPKIRIMTGSYNETLSKTFSKNVRNKIQEKKANKDIVVYSDIFPETVIKKNESSMNLWALEGSYSTYLATSPTGTATGFGCKIMLIDDLLKNDTEAFNENVLDGHWSWFTDTMLSRLEQGGKIIIIMTRWASKDLAGRAIEEFASYKPKILTMKAKLDDGSMLCDEVLSLDDFKMKTNSMSEEIVQANYQQEPIDMKGRLYKSFNTYDTLPVDSTGKTNFDRVFSYCDTADQGKDYLVNIIVGQISDVVYVLDVYCTKDGMDTTEHETAKRLTQHEVNVAFIESNAGGRGFARNIEKEMRALGNKKTIVKWFHQSNNKMARILSGATWVMNNFILPYDWSKRWKTYYQIMVSFQKEGKNKYDDPPDATTGIHDKINETGKFKTMNKKTLGL
jgi:predicted phage terminase large subunit-like protein